MSEAVVGEEVLPFYRPLIGNELDFCQQATILKIGNGKRAMQTNINVCSDGKIVEKSKSKLQVDSKK